MTKRQKLGLALVMVLCGALGMGLFQGGSVLYQDWSFLHTARILAERQAVQRPAQPQPVPPKPVPEGAH